METERLPRKAYNMLVNIHNNGKQCWASALHVNLMMYGFGYVWINQCVQNVNWFLRVFIKERISDCWKQGCDDRIKESDRYSVYRTFKLEFSLEPYFDCVAKKTLRGVFVRLRMGIYEIKTYKLRYSADPSNDLLCPLCKYRLDDENFLFLCKATDYKVQIFSRTESPSSPKQQLTILNDTENMTSVARYIYHSLKLRIQQYQQ